MSQSKGGEHDGSKRHTEARSIIANELYIKALELRKQRLTQREIAQQLGCSIGVVKRAIVVGRKHLENRSSQEYEETVTMELDRLAALDEDVIAELFRTENPSARARLHEIRLRAWIEACRIQGLFRDRVELAGPGGGPVSVGLADLIAAVDPPTRAEILRRVAGRADMAQLAK